MDCNEELGVLKYVEEIEPMLEAIAAFRGRGGPDDDFTAIVPLDGGLRQIFISVFDATEEMLPGDMESH